MKLVRENLFYTVASRIYHYARLRYFLFKCYLRRSKPFFGAKESNLIVSLTSYPPRIDDVWITIESLFLQSYRPWKVVLVLSESEFPERQLPKSLIEQTHRGLEILWTKDNLKSYKKLIPVKNRYPDTSIVTVDDDVVYEKHRIEKLVTASKENEGCVVGCRGKVVTCEGGKLKPYTDWPMATKHSDERRVLLTGVGGILYPPKVIDEKFLLDMNAAQKFCPTADDLWFWAAEVFSSVPVKCIGFNRNMSIRFRENDDSLTKINVEGGANDQQLKALQDEYSIHELVCK
jgi:hypothetical protein